MKKKMFLVLVLALLLGLTTSCSSADSETYSFKTKKLDDSTVEITGFSGDLIDGNLIIPSVIKGREVTRIGTYAFKEIPNLVSVSLPDGVTSIGFGAFESCRSLTSITLPNSLRTIESGAFSSCTALKSIVLPDGVRDLGMSVFSSCSSLSSVTIPNSIYSITASHFFDCISLSQFIIAKDHPSMEVIDGVLYQKDPRKLLYYPSTLSSPEFTIPHGVCCIGERAFYNSKLVSVNIPDTVTSIESEAFGFNENLSTINIPNGVTSISSRLFYSCNSLSSLVLPNSITSIEGCAFAYCGSLQSIYIPSSVTYINDFYPFDACYLLVATIEANPYAEQWCAENNVAYIVVSPQSGNRNESDSTQQEISDNSDVLTNKLSQDNLMCEADWSTPYRTVVSQGKGNPLKGTPIEEGLFGKVLEVKDAVGGWFYFIAPQDGDYSFSVLSPDLSRSSFVIEVYQYTSEQQHLASLVFDKSQSIQTHTVKNIKAGTMICWWDNDNSGRWYTLTDSFALMITCNDQSSDNNAIVWNALNAKFQTAFNNEKLTTLNIEDHGIQMRMDVNTPTVRMLTTWFKQTQIAAGNEGWTANDAMLRFLDAFSWMAQLSQDVLQSYTPYTPVDVNKYTELFDSEGKASVYGLLPAYVTDMTQDEIRWEVLPLTFLDSNSQLYESAMYLYIRIVDEKAATCTEWVLADQQQVYDLLKIIAEYNTTLAADDTDMANLNAWFDDYESTFASSEVALEVEVQTGDEFIFGSYEQDANTKNGKEPIEWIVVAINQNDATVTALSKYCLDVEVYNKTTQDISWADSHMRNWLNEHFYTTAFTPDEQEFIVKTAVNDSNDYVFLLNTNQVNEYLSDKRCYATPFAKKRGIFVSKAGMSSWWVRERNTNTYGVYVGALGAIRENSNTVTAKDNGIRPAITLPINFFLTGD